MSDKKTQVIINSIRKFLVSNEDTTSLKDVAMQLNNLLDIENKKSKVIVYSATELSENIKKNITQKIKNITKKNITPQFLVDKELIAGLKIKIDDYIIDMTINNNLNQIAESLK